MNDIPVSELKPNTYFNLSVYLEENYILLTSDTPVTIEMIERLRKWNYTKVYSSGNSSHNEQRISEQKMIFEPSPLDEDVEVKKQIKDISSFYLDLINYCDNVFKEFILNNSLDISSITEKVKEIIEKLKEHNDIILIIPSLQQSDNNYLVTHSINTTIYSLAIGDFLKLPSHRLIELGLSAFLHEIGMSKIPSSLFLSSKALSEQEKKTVMAHTILGYRILKGYSVNEKVAQVALEHHERMDGSGYPKGLSGNSISIYARIIAVICSYESQINKRPFKELKNSHVGIMDLLKNNRKGYDETILKALVYCLSIFPLGSYVLLNNNAKGIVFKTNPENPQYPIVKILQDQNGNRVNAQLLVKTSQEKEIVISRILTIQEIEDFKLE